MKICVICGKKFEEWGNNPWPVKDEGVCCNKCNDTVVFPQRLAMAYSRSDKFKLTETPAPKLQIDKDGNVTVKE